METNLQDLREQYKELTTEQSDIVKRWEDEKRAGSEEEITRHDAIDNDLEKLQAEIATLERCEKAKSKKTELKRSIYEFGAPSVRIGNNRQITKADRNNALRAWFSGEEYNDTIKRSCDKLNFDCRTKEFIVRDAAQSVDVATEGQETIDGSRYQGHLEAKKSIGGLESVSHVIHTAKAYDIHFSGADNTARTGSITADNVAVTNTEVVFDKYTLRDFTVKSGIFPISYNLVEDSEMDILGYLDETVGRGLHRAKAAKIAVGAGTTEPKGLLADVQTAVNAFSFNITAQDLYSMYFAVDSEYRDNAVWVMSDHTLSTLMTSLVDNENRPQWGVGLNGSPEASLLGKRIVIDNNYPSQSQGNVRDVITFGDHYYHKVRYTGGVRLVKTADRYADQLAWGVFGYVRMDSLYCNPAASVAQAPVVALTTGALSGDPDSWVGIGGEIEE